MSQVVLFGATGFLGSHVWRVVGERGANVTCVSREAREGGVARKCDVRDLESVIALLDSLQPDSVLNCAALSRAADCFESPDLARSTNRDFPKALASWTASHDSRLVHVSTDMVFAGDAPSGGYLEDSSAKPVSEYGRSKLAGEHAVLEANPRALVVRLPLLFGDSEGRELGASDSILAAVRRGEEPRLFTDEWRTPLEVGDAARALVELSASDASGVLHVASEERVSRFELGELVLAAHRLPLELVRASTQSEAELSEPRPRDASLNAERARARVECELRGPRAFFTHAG